MRADRFERTARLLNSSQTKALRDAHVAVLGLGGVGSHATLALARAGVGNLFLQDADVIESSNLNRQAFAFNITVGEPKSEVARRMVANINPACRVATSQNFILSKNVTAMLQDLLAWAPKQLYIIDALDSIAIKLALGQETQTHPRVALISVTGTANKLDPTKLSICDIFQTHNDSIARVMRKEARKRGITHLTVVSSAEETGRVSNPPGTQRSERAGMGTISYIPAIAGNMAAGWVIQQIVAK